MSNPYSEFKTQLQGSMVALVTPMLANGDIDYPRLADLIDWHIEQGTDCLVAVGTTGESATLSMQEHSDVIRFFVKHVNGRIPVIAGTGANNTLEAIQLTSDPNKAIGSEEDYFSDRRDENPIWGDEDKANGGLWN